MIIDKSMARGEEVRIICPTHKIIFMLPLLMILFGAAPLMSDRIGNVYHMAFDVFGIDFQPSTSYKRPTSKQKADAKIFEFVFPFLFLGIAIFVIKFLQLRHCERILTNQRIFSYRLTIAQRGYTSSQTDEMQISELASITIERTFFGQIFNYGTLCFISKKNERVRFRHVPDVRQVKRLYKEYFAELGQG